MKNKVTFSDLSFSYPPHSIRVAGFDIPFHIHIKDIKFKNDETLKVMLYEHHDKMQYEYGKLKQIKFYESYLDYIDVKSKLYDGLTKNFLEYHNLNHIYEILDSFDENDMSIIIKEVDSIITVLIKLFKDRVVDMLELKNSAPTISLKEKHTTPQNIKEYLSYSAEYIQVQMGMEYHPTIYFPENMNKCVSEWSFREMELHMCYLTIKSRKENTADLYQAKRMEEIKK